MITGHFGVAAAARAGEPRVPIWLLMLATMWLDLLFGPLVLLKVESMHPVPGTNGGYGEGIIHADYTHSLLGALVLSAALGALTAAKLGRRAGIVVGSVAFSHWLLDLVVYRPDMPILPGNLGGLPRLGFGLWQTPVAAAVVEAVLFAGGFLLYLRSVGKVADRPTATRLALTVAVSGAVVLGLDLAGL